MSPSNVPWKEPSLLLGYEDRPGSAADLDTVIDLVRRAEIDDHGRVTADWEAIAPIVFGSPGFAWADDSLVVERAGEAVAFTGVFSDDEDGAAPFRSWLVCDAAHQEAVVPSLIDWDVARARQRDARALRHLAYRNDERHRAMLESRGFRRVRSMWTMHRTLENHEPPVETPAGITIATLGEHRDERALYEVEQEAFSDHFGFVPEPFDAWRHRRFDDGRDDGDDWLSALDGDRVVAFLHEATGGEVAQVAVLGTLPAWRGRGIATALLRTSFARMARRGHPEVTLWVDSENETGAVGLYESVGMRPIVIDDTYELDLSVRA